MVRQLRLSSGLGNPILHHHTSLEFTTLQSLLVAAGITHVKLGRDVVWTLNALVLLIENRAGWDLALHWLSHVESVTLSTTAISLTGS